MALDLGHCLWPFAISAQVLEPWVQYKQCLIGGSDFFFSGLFCCQMFWTFELNLSSYKGKDDKSHLTSSLPSLPAFTSRGSKVWAHLSLPH